MPLSQTPRTIRCAARVSTRSSDVLVVDIAGRCAQLEYLAPLSCIILTPTFIPGEEVTLLEYGRTLFGARLRFRIGRHMKIESLKGHNISLLLERLGTLEPIHAPISWRLRRFMHSATTYKLT